MENPGNALIFSFAGHDTTGNTLTWLIYELAKSNIRQKRLQHEVDDFWREQGERDIEYQDFKKHSCYDIQFYKSFNSYRR